jgi:penicillin-binding protein 2
VHQREFGEGDLANTSIGQGDVLVTPVQMADLMATYANDGTVYRPRLVRQLEDRDGKVIKEFPVGTLRTVSFDEKDMAYLRKAMINVTTEGTAKIVHRDDMEVAAKTGTAQVGSKEHRRQIAWLCGYFPAEAPKYSFAVMVEGTFADNHGSGLEDGLLGGRDAGAIVKEILDTLYGAKGKKGDEPAISKADAEREATPAVEGDDADAAARKNAPPADAPATAAADSKPVKTDGTAP